jgi:hypothetical protein
MRLKMKVCTPTKYISKIAVYITFGVLMILFISVFFFVKQSKEDRLISMGDHIVSEFRAGLDYFHCLWHSLKMANLKMHLPPTMSL